jgi:MFS transporter, OFA family, oxalate/formate antiporter
MPFLLFSGAKPEYVNVFLSDFRPRCGPRQLALSSREEEISMSANSHAKGWIVTFCGMGINLALGVLYAWSVISKGIPDAWGWTEAQKSFPYALACMVFALMMVPAGRLQDKAGPRLTATIGGVLVGLGLILASRFTSPAMYIAGFGILAGAGIGFGYAASTPPAVKWFPPEKTGLVTGIVVAGFGLASVYVAPMTNALIESAGLQDTLLILGLAFSTATVGLAQFLKEPPAGYSAKGMPALPGKAAPVSVEYTPLEMLRTRQFYLLWVMYACGAGAGLMIISKMALIAGIQAGIHLGFILVAVLAVGNGAGRIIAGFMSDRLGRRRTLFAVFVLQAGLILLLSRVQVGSALAGAVMLGGLTILIGASYGANLALFPAFTKDYYGLKNFGVNYGLVFTAWGFGGFLLSLLAGTFYDRYNTFVYAYYGAAALLAAGAAISLFLTPPRRISESQPELPWVIDLDQAEDSAQIHEGTDCGRR